jgi:hypothetical protein
MYVQGCCLLKSDPLCKKLKYLNRNIKYAQGNHRFAIYQLIKGHNFGIITGENKFKLDLGIALVQ